MKSSATLTVEATCNLLAVHALETIGTQEYDLKPGPLADRCATAYGEAAAAEVAAHLAS